MEELAEVNIHPGGKVEFKTGKESKGKDAGGDYPPGKKASDKQIGFMKHKAKDAKLPEDALKNHLLVLGYQSEKDVPMGKVNDILAWISDKEKEAKDSLV